MIENIWPLSTGINYSFPHEIETLIDSRQVAPTLIVDEIMIGWITWMINVIKITFLIVFMSVVGDINQTLNSFSS